MGLRQTHIPLNHKLARDHEFKIENRARDFATHTQLKQNSQQDSPVDGIELLKVSSLQCDTEGNHAVLIYTAYIGVVAATLV